jgi:hypothetical protein
MDIKFLTDQNLKVISAALLILLGNLFPLFAQPGFEGKKELFTTPLQYIVPFTNSAPVVDGKIDDVAWQNSPWTDSFIDIEGQSKPLPTWSTRAKMTWTNDGLYIAAEIIDPHVWAYLKNQDDIVFYDNDFEVFIDPDNDTHNYYEIEVNAVNTIFDLFMPKPYRNGSGAMIVYDTPGLKSAVSVKGTLNNPNDKDTGWTVEMFVPFKAVTIANNVKIPTDGDFWRVNFSRVEWDVKAEGGKYVKLKSADGRNLPEHNWVWSPQGVINMHYPERWGYIIFSKSPSTQPSLESRIPYSEFQKKHLWNAYYLQKEHFQKNQVYAKELQDLGIASAVDVEGKKNRIWMEASSQQFMVYISNDENIYSVNEEGLIKKIMEPAKKN